MQNKKVKNSKLKFVLAAGLLVIAAGTMFLTNGKSNDQGKGSADGSAAQFSENGDMLIPVAEVTEKANFYQYESEDGTNLEVLAIKASDGTIRTAFNTCQVCYSSGRGYYEQEGDSLVCQNCGNRFAATDVEVAKGGCNPVPIFSENKTVDESNITISKDFLEEAKVIFQNWK